MLLTAMLLAAASEPAATVRVSFDHEGEAAVQASGFADIATGRKVTADDPVRMASISKLVTAIAVMRLYRAGAPVRDDNHGAKPACAVQPATEEALARDGEAAQR